MPRFPRAPAHARARRRGTRTRNSTNSRRCRCKTLSATTRSVCPASAAAPASSPSPAPSRSSSTSRSTPRSSRQSSGRNGGTSTPHHDGSLHLNLPTPLAEHLIELGWAEFHPVVTWGLAPPMVVMLYGPRDGHELAVARGIVEAAYVAAGGARTDASGRPLASALGPPPVADREGDITGKGA